MQIPIAVLRSAWRTSGIQRGTGRASTVWTTITQRLLVCTAVAHRAILPPLLVVVGRLGVVIIIGTRLVVTAQRGQAITRGQVRERRSTGSRDLS